MSLWAVRESLGTKRNVVKRNSVRIVIAVVCIASCRSDRAPISAEVMPHPSSEMVVALLARHLVGPPRSRWALPNCVGGADLVHKRLEAGSRNCTQIDGAHSKNYEALPMSSPSAFGVSDRGR